MVASTEVRSQIAKDIMRIRGVEIVDPPYNVLRDANDYYYKLYGLDHTLIHTANAKGALLDIGSGQCKAIEQIARRARQHHRDIQVFATGLRPLSKKRLLELDGLVDYRITLAETLRGFMPSSITAVIGVYSFPYFSDPVMAVKSIDRVLVAGGIVKAVFPSWTERYPSNDGETICAHTVSCVLDLFANIGYDIHNHRDVLLTAVKPGQNAPRAQYIFQRDSEKYSLEPCII